MKSILFIFSFLVLVCRNEDNQSYTASTPANSIVRHFLGINQKDSIDFIRWNLKISDAKDFALSCTYGIGRPNTNGFIDEKKVALKGKVTFSNGILTLHDKGRSLSMQVLNRNILHILNDNENMMIGNGGWSYTLNSLDAVSTNELNLKQKNVGFRDSIIFIGRTPCRGMEELLYQRTRPECYKKKWVVRLYKKDLSASSGTYKIGSDGSRTGKWILKQTRSGKVMYSLDLNNGNFLDLLPSDGNVVFILDGKGGIMVGDHDFSYSLNRSIH